MGVTSVFRVAFAIVFSVATLNFAAPCFCAFAPQADAAELEAEEDEHSCCAGMLGDEEAESEEEPAGHDCPHCGDGSCSDVSATDPGDMDVVLAKDGRVVIPPPQRHFQIDYAEVLAQLRPIELQPLVQRGPPTDALIAGTQQDTYVQIQVLRL